MIKHLFLFVALLSFSFCFPQFGEQQIISIEALNPHDVITVDIDGDGDMDVLTASAGDEKIAWYKNLDGLGNFGEQQVITNNLQDTRCIFSSDIDGDGDMDIISGSLVDDKVVWFKNLDGLGNFSNQIEITIAADGALYVFSEDIDGDGDMDVLSASVFDNKIAWYENLDGLGNFGTQQIITNSAYSVRSVFATDLDNDGDIDVLCDSSNGSYPSWHENLDGLGNFGPEQEITQESGSQFAIAADIDGDGDMDILNVNFGGGLIYLSKNIDGLGNFGAIEIISELIKPVKIYATDLDNDGDLDVVSVSHDDLGGSVFWHENIDGLGNFSEKQIISSNIIGGRGVFAADIDGDGDMDVLSASIADHKIAWYENLTILGIEEINDDTFDLYPNPTQDILNIESQEPIETVKIYSLQGQLIKESSKSSVDVSQLTAGMYFAQVTIEGKTVTKKFIKE